MARVHERSSDCLKSELDLFDPPSTLTSIDKGCWYEYPPTTTLTDNGPLEFYVSGSGNEYIDLQHTRLYLKVRIVNSNGDRLDRDHGVAPVNYMLASMFSQVEVTLNGKAVGHANSLYPYRAIFEVLMNYGKGAADTHLQSGLFYKDTAGYLATTDPQHSNPDNWIGGYDSHKALLTGHTTIRQAGADGTEHEVHPPVEVDQANVGNNGLYHRWRMTCGSQWVELEGPIHADIFQQEKYLLNSVDLGLKLVRQRPEFALTAINETTDFKIQIQDACLFVRKVSIADSVFLAHQHALLKANAIYPINHVVMKSFSISAGTRTGPQDNIFLGTLPQEMIVAFVDNSAQSGSYLSTPFDFKHMNIRYMVCKYGNYTVPAKPFNFSFNDNQPNGGFYARAYHQMFAANSKILKDEGGLIERKDFPRGYALFAFDFRPDIGTKGCYSLKQTGAVQLEIQFDIALPRTINMVVCGGFDSYFEITSSREIITLN